ncbi:hypothetical protein Bbelb_268710 [Branchiostoma belcheri]|nr:hypothetical protein Bbelb_268710 [Branchiostoma belcheri]
MPALHVRPAREVTPSHGPASHVPSSALYKDSEVNDPAFRSLVEATGSTHPPRVTSEGSFRCSTGLLLTCIVPPLYNVPGVNGRIRTLYLRTGATRDPVTRADWF